MDETTEIKNPARFIGSGRSAKARGEIRAGDVSSGIAV